MTKITYTIQDFKAERLNRGFIQSDIQDAHTAILKFDNGDWMAVSRYHDEKYWVVDAAFRANGFPIFSNGTGSRCTAIQTLTPEHAAALDDRLALERAEKFIDGHIEVHIIGR